jgi:hypothetical protein
MIYIKKHIGMPVNGHDKSRVQNLRNHSEGKMLAKNWSHIFILQICTVRSTSLLKRFQAEGPVRFRTEGDLALQKFEVYDEKK